MSGKTVLLNGVSGSGKSTIIKTLANKSFANILSIISPINYQKGTTSTNVKYTFGDCENVRVAGVVINDFDDEWLERSKIIEQECNDKETDFDIIKEKDDYFTQIKKEFINANYIINADIDFDSVASIKQLENRIIGMNINEILKLINKSNIGQYLLSVEINIPASENLKEVLKKHKLEQISIIDTKGLGQDDKTRHIDFACIDAMLFISDGSKITDMYQAEIQKDFKSFLKSTPIMISLRHTFDLSFDNYSGFNNSLLISTAKEKYLECLNKYCSNLANPNYIGIKNILNSCGLCNGGLVSKIVEKYTFNALPEDYSKDNLMDGKYALKTEEFYVAAVLNMIDRCLFAIDDYINAYDEAKNVLLQKGQIINSTFTDVTDYGCYMVKQIEGENRNNARILRAYPDQLGTYGWVNYALSNNVYEKKRLRISLYNIVDLAIDYSLTSLVNNSLITSKDAEILSVYFSIELKAKSSWVSMGYDRLGVNSTAVTDAIIYLINKEKTNEYQRLHWHYIVIGNMKSIDSCSASTLFELYLGLFASLQLVKFDKSILDRAMVKAD